jgi:hypothetical protein
MIVPVIDECAPQTNEYVPTVLNVQLPDQPAGDANPGSGGTVPGHTMPEVCVHDVGDCAPSKTMLWTLPPVGYENVTTPPAATFTTLSVWLAWDPS